jgi:hypothetical protein
MNPETTTIFLVLAMPCLVAALVGMAMDVTHGIVVWYRQAFSGRSRTSTATRPHRSGQLARNR